MSEENSDSAGITGSANTTGSASTNGSASTTGSAGTTGSTGTTGSAGTSGSTGEVQLDNGVFRVTKWTIEPDGVIPMHTHDHEYVVVPLVTDTMRVRSSDGTVITAELETGVTYTRPAGAEHEVSNPGGTSDVVFVEVERL